MADMNLNTKSLLSQITNDVKIRSLFEGAGADLSNNSQFLDVMMARLSALGSTDSVLKAFLKKVSQSDQGARTQETAYTQNLKGVRRDDKVEAKAAPSASETTAVDPSVKAKIKSKIKEIAERHNAPVEDDRALKALEKVAEFLVNAEAEGRVDLPPALVENLKAFLAKDDSYKAFDTAEFMHDFIAAFRSMIVSVQQPQATDGETLEWPADVLEALQGLDMGFFPGTDGKALDIRDIMMTVKALANASETAAVDTLNAKATDALLPQDQAGLLTIAPVTQEAVKPEQTIEEKISALILDSVKAFQEQEALKAAQKAQQALGVTQAIPHAKIDQSAVSTVLASDIDAALSGKVSSQTQDALGNELSFDQNGNHKKSDGYISAGESDYQPTQQTARNTTSFTAATPVASEVKAQVSAQVTQNGLNAMSGVESTQATAVATGAHAPSTSAAARTALQQAQAQPTPATQQVIVQLQNKAGKEGQISVQLSPAELGRVDVRLTIDRNGQTHAVIMADRPETLALLQKDSSFLERALQQAGLNAQSQNMSFNLREQRQNEFGQSRKRFTRETLDDVKPIEAALTVSSEGTVITDKRVNYHA